MLLLPNKDLLLRNKELKQLITTMQESLRRNFGRSGHRTVMPMETIESHSTSLCSLTLIQSVSTSIRSPTRMWIWIIWEKLSIFLMKTEMVSSPRTILLLFILDIIRKWSDHMIMKSDEQIVTISLRIEKSY